MVRNDQLMELVQNYLGVVVSSDLRWSKHIQLIRVNILGLLYCSFAKYIYDPSAILKLYKALIWNNFTALSTHAKGHSGA